KADGKIIGYIRNANGAFSFDVPETLYGKNLSVEIVPAAGVYSLNTYTQNLGTVSKVMFDASKVENGVTWSYDASEDTEDSIVIVALYNADDEMIKCEPVAITAGQSYGDTVTDSAATLAKVFHWVSTSDAEPIEKNLSIDLSK
ncbi:MAG: hypothetical protein IJC78_02800, partial [Clostridia bacterium]|nr:hypothetical protein [Clostridia bacterium]